MDIKWTGVVNGMFRGEYYHNLDDKYRMIVPYKFRDRLGERFIITRSPDKCLYVFTSADWEELEKKVENLPILDENSRKFMRYFWGAAYEAERDNQYRVVIPPNLRKHAGIEKEIVSVGVGRRAEIWGRENYERYLENGENLNPEVTAHMAELGI